MVEALRGEVVNFEAFNARLQRAIKVVKNLKPVFLLIASDWYKDEKQIFQLQSAGQYPDYKGKRGADGMTAYMRAKLKRRGFIYPLLKDSGRLEASVTNPSSKDAVYEISEKHLTIGSNVPYAIYHQSEEPREKLPYRPFIINHTAKAAPASDMFGKAVKRWTRTLDTYVKKQLGGIYGAY